MPLSARHCFQWNHYTMALTASWSKTSCWLVQTKDPMRKISCHLAGVYCVEDKEGQGLCSWMYCCLHAVCDAASADCTLPRPRGWTVSLAYCSHHVRSLSASVHYGSDLMKKETTNVFINNKNEWKEFLWLPTAQQVKYDFIFIKLKTLVYVIKLSMVLSLDISHKICLNVFRYWDRYI